MNKNKGFFAPSWDFFSWSEIKCVISTSIILAWRTAKELFKTPLWALLFVVTAGMLDAASVDLFGAIITFLSQADALLAGKIVVVLFIPVLFLFFLYVPYRVLSRVVLSMNALSGITGRSADSVLARENEASNSFGLRLLALSPRSFAGLFVLFMDVRAKEKSSWYSIKRSFWMALRLLPASIPIMLIFLVLFVPLSMLALSGGAGLVYLSLAKMTAVQIMVSASVVSFLAAPIMLLLVLSFQHTLYTRIIARHSDLIFEETSEKFDEQD